MSFVFPHISNKHCYELWLPQHASSTTRNIELGLVIECVGVLIPRESWASLRADTADDPKEYVLKYPVGIFNSILDISARPQTIFGEELRGCAATKPPVQQRSREQSRIHT